MTENERKLSSRERSFLRYLEGENINLSSADREGHGR